MQKQKKTTTEMMMKRSTRKKPFTDLTNAAATNPVPKFPVNKNKLEDDDDDAEVADLDSLLLLHSNLSSIIHQVDELVAKVLQAPSKVGKEDIESFTQVLSEIQSTLKPWPLRFQKALSTNSSETEKCLNQSLVSETVHGSEETSDVVQSPEESKFDSMISPSPLVAWRGEFNVDGGRQLFLLTPLPRSKAYSSNPRGLLKSEIDKFKYDNGLQSLMAISTDTNDDLLEDRKIKLTPENFSDIVENKENSTEEEPVSPPKVSQPNRSVLVFTPCMKMSPPKSCVLLEPVSEMAHRSYFGVRKATPFPIGRLQGVSSSESSESSSGRASDDLTLKYPELFGIQPIHKLGNERKEIDSSPDWFMSPPRSCVLMEPSDEKLLTDAIKRCQLSRAARIPDQPKDSPMEKRDGGKIDFPGRDFGDNYAFVESTPMFKEPESTFRAGKNPGENTLKKELWTKFEAASDHDFQFDVSVLKTAQRGFLDRLEEVSVDETDSSS